MTKGPRRARPEPVRITPTFRPRQLEKTPPCQDGCPISGDVRTWLGIVAQRDKLGLTPAQAYERAWQVIVDRNPMPSALGRICPHPCETNCNRSVLDESVSIHSMERFLGDWALSERLPLNRLEEDEKPESIGVIGSGPSGLSFAYQMARRGYRVTVYEQRSRTGGMLRYGIPNYRLPPEILDAEIDRIVGLGVEVCLDTTVGDDVSLAELRERHAALYVAIGAQSSRELGIGGDADDAVWDGIEYLYRVNRGESIEVGTRVAVIGGGNTAVDAARTARRAGAEVTIVYRRSRAEMPALGSEVGEAEAEGVRLLLLRAPVEIERHGDCLSLTVNRMELGEPDESGRRRPIAVPDSESVLSVHAVIVAISQEPEWSGLEELQRDGRLACDATGAIDDSMLGGGDVVESGICGMAIAHGRRAAEVLHHRLRGLSGSEEQSRRLMDPTGLRLDSYAPVARAETVRLAPKIAVSKPDAEVDLGIGEAQFLIEAGRCLSCGSCFGCEQCWMFCTVQSFSRLSPPNPGAYFSLSLDLCLECGKCIEVCPCGFLEVAEPASTGLGGQSP
jgi:NADPH-dependent glutamate synthase beta subunit-like oxidoreductase/Pyruvate/2-oxoacid:ferredoxin oxidoreductase delta subunit